MNQEKRTNKAKVRAALKVPFLVTLIATAITVLAFFMPIASANEEHEKRLQEYAEEFYVEEIEMLNEDAIHISMYEFARMQWEIYSHVDKTLAVVVTAMIGTVGILSLMTLLFSLWKKPIAVFIFNLFTFGAYYLMVWDFKVRGVMPNSNYEWGCAYYLYFVGLVLTFVGAIWLFIKKRKVKKEIYSNITE